MSHWRDDGHVAEERQTICNAKAGDDQVHSQEGVGRHWHVRIPQESFYVAIWNFAAGLHKGLAKGVDDAAVSRVGSATGAVSQSVVTVRAWISNANCKA